MISDGGPKHDDSHDAVAAVSATSSQRQIEISTLLHRATHAHCVLIKTIPLIFDHNLCKNVDRNSFTDRFPMKFPVYRWQKFPSYIHYLCLMSPLL